MLENSFCAYLIFRALILVGFTLLHLEARFFLSTNVCHGTLDLALYLLGMHSAAASNWTFTKKE